MVKGGIVGPIALILELYPRLKPNPNPKLANIGKYYYWAIFIFVKKFLILVLIPHKWHGESSNGFNFSKKKIVIVAILKIKLGFDSILAHLDSKPMVNYQLAPHFKLFFSK